MSSKGRKGDDLRGKESLAGCIEYVFKTCWMLRWSLETICSKRYTIPVHPTVTIGREGGKNDSLLSAHCKTLAQRLAGCMDFILF